MTSLLDKTFKFLNNNKMDLFSNQCDTDNLLETLPEEIVGTKEIFLNQAVESEDIKTESILFSKEISDLQEVSKYDIFKLDTGIENEILPNIEEIYHSFELFESLAIELEPTDNFILENIDSTEHLKPQVIEPEPIESKKTESIPIFKETLNYNELTTKLEAINDVTESIPFSKKHFEYGEFSEPPTIQSKNIQTEKILLSKASIDNCLRPKLNFISKTMKIKKNKMFECNNCWKLFIRRSNLIVHLKKYSHDKPYKCNSCDKSLITLSGFQIHMKTHKAMKTNKFKCDYCGQFYARRSYLTEHHRIHTGEKPFECTTCNKSFRIFNQLTNHSRIHTGEKPYVCTLCNTSYSSSANRRYHMKSHSDPYKCLSCSKGYSRKHDLKRHMERNHDLQI